jgi:hypothetical protein
MAYIYEIWLEKQGVCERQTCGISLKIITAGMYTHIRTIGTELLTFLQFPMELLDIESV